MSTATNLWHPPALSYLSEQFAKTRGYALSIHALGASLGDMLAPLAAGMMLLTFDWRNTALLAALPAIVIAALIGAMLRPNAPAAVLASQSRGLGITEYAQGLLAVLRDRVVLSICTMSALRSMTQNGLIMFLPLYLVNVAGAGPATIGLTLAVLQVGAVIATPLAGIWSDRAGRRSVVMAGLTASTLIIFSLNFLGSGLAFVFGISLLGFALFAIRPVVQSWVMDLVPPHMAGSATSLMFGTQSAFSILMPVVGGLVADTFGLVAVFYLLGATMLLSNTMVFALPRDTIRFRT